MRKGTVFLLVAAVLLLGGVAAVFESISVNWNIFDPVERGDPLPPGPLGDPLPPGPL